MKSKWSKSLETLNSGQNQWYFARVTSNFDGWPSKTIRHLFRATSSCVHHFIAICEFKLKLQSGNAQFRSKSIIFFSLVTLKFDRWPWKTIWHLSWPTSSFVHHFIAIGKLKLELQYGNTQFGSKSAFFVPCDLWIWWMTLKNNRHLFYATPSIVHHFIAICEFKLELQSRNAQFRSESINFFSHVTLTFDRWP